MRWLAVVSFNVLLLLGILEIGVHGLLANPGLLLAGPDPMLWFFREFHMKHDRSIIQYDSRFAVFHPVLGYRLRPGRFRFENREFSTAYEVNSAGLRDDEASLEAPEIIVLGDSFAMGWGVEQDETFAQLIEAETGRKVLNAGIASYGTAREMNSLALVDTSDLQVLIIQYEKGDANENRRWDPDAERPLQEEEGYRRVVREHESDLRYYPGRYALRLLGDVVELLGDRLPELLPGVALAARAAVEGGVAADVDRFLAVVAEGSPIDLAGVTIMVFAVGGYGGTLPDFIEALETRSRDPRHPPELRSLITVPLDPEIREHAFVFDDHLRPEGHAMIARAILARLPERRRGARELEQP